MHVIVATDGSRQSLAAAKHLKSFADPTKVTEISVVAVIRPLASVAFADDLSEDGSVDGSFRDAAESARGRRSPPSSTAGDPRSTSASAAARPPTRSSRPPSSTTPGWSWSQRAVAA